MCHLDTVIPLRNAIQSLIPNPIHPTQLQGESAPTPTRGKSAGSADGKGSDAGTEEAEDEEVDEEEEDAEDSGQELLPRVCIK